MASPRWRMNGLWRRMAGALLLCALLLTNEVTCQDEPAIDAIATPTPDPTADTIAPDAAGSTTPGTTGGPGADQTAVGITVTAGTIPPVKMDDSNPSVRLDDGSSGASGSITASSADDQASDNSDASTGFAPRVTCVSSDDISNANAIKVETTTADCEETRRIISEKIGPVCGESECDLKLFQNEKTVLVASNKVDSQAVARALMSDSFKDKLTVTEPESAASSGSSVFVGILVSGLLAALGITIGYFKCQRRSDTKGVKLAEDPFPVDQENQGNTLVSVAPLNPPPEPQDKPSVNGESPEAAKTQPPPPTNGHSTTKTADTEL